MGGFPYVGWSVSTVGAWVVTLLLPQFGCGCSILVLYTMMGVEPMAAAVINWRLLTRGMVNSNRCSGCSISMCHFQHRFKA